MQIFSWSYKLPRASAAKKVQKCFRELPPVGPEAYFTFLLSNSLLVVTSVKITAAQMKQLRQKAKYPWLSCSRFFQKNIKAIVFSWSKDIESILSEDLANLKNLNKKGAASKWGPATDNFIQRTEWEAIAAEGGTSLTLGPKSKGAACRR